MLSVLGVHNGSDTAWYIVQIVQLIFMREKMRAWMNPDGQNSYGLVNGGPSQPAPLQPLQRVEGICRRQDQIECNHINLKVLRRWPRV